MDDDCTCAYLNIVANMNRPKNDGVRPKHDIIAECQVPWQDGSPYSDAISPGQLQSYPSNCTASYNQS